MDHVMVIPNHGSVRIGDGPTIETRGADLADYVRVDGESVYVGVASLHLEPRPIPGTPYEAYALGSWILGEFAIRLREETP
jgi:hypothetical protein